eukprot:2008309-Lingulodinium_polyedra.AAC.1
MEPGVDASCSKLLMVSFEAHRLPAHFWPPLDLAENLPVQEDSPGPLRGNPSVRVAPLLLDPQPLESVFHPLGGAKAEHGSHRGMDRGWDSQPIGLGQCQHERFDPG